MCPLHRLGCGEKGRVVFGLCWKHYQKCWRDIRKRKFSLATLREYGIVRPGKRGRPAAIREIFPDLS